MNRFKQVLIVGAAIFGVGSAFTTKQNAFSARTYGITALNNHVYSVVLFQPTDDCTGTINTCSYQINDGGVTFSTISTTNSLIIKSTKVTGAFGS